uniref:Sulfatase N-terminal domain-containing protein n=1 Tax=Glossina pallidipes TaxID=7398 RepID=A0A1A9Z969_GLOPL
MKIFYKLVQKVCIALVAFVSLYRSCAFKFEKGKRSNVVLVVFDDLRPTLGRFGDRLAFTPNLDAFISRSNYFTRAYSQQALCAPSRNSFLTSRRPDTLHLYDFYSYWRTFVGNFTTLPQYFKEHGYHTYAIGKVFHPGVSSNYNDDYPHSWSASPYHPSTEIYMNTAVCPDAYGVLKNNLLCPVHLRTQPFQTLPDIQSTAEAIRFLKSYRNSTANPFFLALGFHKPHINFRFPIHYMKRFPLENFYNYTPDTFRPNEMPKVAWNPYSDIRSRDDFCNLNISFPYGPIPALLRAQIRQAYYASVSYVDNLFGKFIKHVDSENTIIVVTSDHGWSLGEHAEWAKYSNFEVAVRVPLIVQSPEFHAPYHVGKSIKDIIELVDLFPSLVDLAHLPRVPKCIRNVPMFKQLLCTEGKSFYKLLQGNDTKKHYIALSQYPRPGVLPTKHPNSDKPKLRNIKIMGYSLRTNYYRYTIWVRFHPNNFSRDWSTVYGEEMYSHRHDVGEEINLVNLPQFNKVRGRLKSKLIAAFTK